MPAETGTVEPPGAGIPPAIVAQAAILAAHAEAWGLPTLTRLAASFSGGSIVVTTSPPGLVTWSELIARLPAPLAERTATVTEIEYRGWCMRSPDETHRLHAVAWSWIKAPLPPQRRGDFPAFPIPDGADYWVLRYGHAGGGEERHGADLYTWDGVRATRLATGITERFHKRG